MTTIILYYLSIGNYRININLCDHFSLSKYLFSKAILISYIGKENVEISKFTFNKISLFYVKHFLGWLSRYLVH
jgi:hypothetical protein